MISLSRTACGTHKKGASRVESEAPSAATLPSAPQGEFRGPRQPDAKQAPCQWFQSCFETPSAVQYLKGRRSHKLLAEFASLRKRYWGQHLWARGYWVASSGNVTDEVWMEYIKSQTQAELD